MSASVDNLINAALKAVLELLSTNPPSRQKRDRVEEL